MGHFVPHTDAEIAEMLASLGLSSLDDLFAVIPAALRLAGGAGGLALPPGMSEPDVLDRIDHLAATNRAVGSDLVCFAGAGAYDHDIPSVVAALAFRSEFVTAYTPYQPEVAQGVLQALFEYQTLVCRLAGMEVANASLYDGASACVEAVNLSVAATGRRVVWVSRGVHPHWREVMATFAAGSGHQLRIVDLADGVTAWPSASEDDGGPPGAILLQQPNFLGCLEDVAAAVEVARATGAHVIVAADPVSLGLLKPPGGFGVDVVVGEGQPFGTPLSFGGPYLGLFACRREHLRRLPGRLVGETVDVDGRRAYVTTLRTPGAGHPPRAGLVERLHQSDPDRGRLRCPPELAGHRRPAGAGPSLPRGTRYARESLLALDGVAPLVGAPVLREFALRLPIPADEAVERMAEEGFLAGVPVGDEYDGGGSGLLVAVTERRTRAQIDDFVVALDKVLR